MRIVTGLFLAVAVSAAAVAQPAGPPLEDTRVATAQLVREDLFAGFLDNDMARFERGERSIESLMKSRPDQRATLLAWQGGAVLYRAARANEAGKSPEYKALLTKAYALLDEAAQAGGANNLGVIAPTGGVFVLFSDRLAPADRAAAWQRGYVAYQQLWAMQNAFADKLPPHIRGELMSGLVQTAQRTGRTAEAQAQLDRMLTLVGDASPYAPLARTWKSDPKAMATTNLTCKNCHEPGRLEPTLKALNSKPAS